MSVTLPYPSIVFVPLDVLTAEELNQLNANTQYIANQFPLSAANINTSSFKLNPLFMQTGSAEITIKADSGAGGGVSVTFPTAFQNIPNLNLTLHYDNTRVAEVLTMAVSKTGFTALARSTATFDQPSYTFDWLAIDKTQSPVGA